jgi:hypothetical protein
MIDDFSMYVIRLVAIGIMVAAVFLYRYKCCSGDNE